jgi:hypothetical protein
LLALFLLDRPTAKPAPIAMAKMMTDSKARLAQNIVAGTPKMRFDLGSLAGRGRP